MFLGRTDSKEPRQPALGEMLTMHHPENSIVSENRKFRQETKIAIHDSSVVSAQPSYSRDTT